MSKCSEIAYPVLCTGTALGAVTAVFNVLLGVLLGDRDQPLISGTSQNYLNAGVVFGALGLLALTAYNMPNISTIHEISSRETTERVERMGQSLELHDE